MISQIIKCIIPNIFRYSKIRFFTFRDTLQLFRDKDNIILNIQIKISREMYVWIIIIRYNNNNHNH